MALYALTALRVGKDDGEVIVYDERDKIDEGDFTKEQLEELQALGSVGVLAVSPEEASKDREELLDKIARLEAELAASTGTRTVKPTERLEGTDASLDDQLAQQEKNAVGGAKPADNAATPSNPGGDQEASTRKPSSTSRTSGSK
jgi:hypothetical protein